MKKATMEQVLTLRKQGKTLREIADITDTTEANICQILRRAGKNDKVRAFRENKAEAFEKIQEEIIKTMTTKEIKTMKPKEKIQALVMLNDQVRKERGLDGQNGVTVNIALLNEVYERAVSFFGDK